MTFQIAPSEAPDEPVWNISDSDKTNYFFSQMHIAIIKDFISLSKVISSIGLFLHPSSLVCLSIDFQTIQFSDTHWISYNSIKFWY